MLSRIREGKYVLVYSEKAATCSSSGLHGHTREEEISNTKHETGTIELGARVC